MLALKLKLKNDIYTFQLIMRPKLCGYMQQNVSNLPTKSLYLFLHTWNALKSRTATFVLGSDVKLNTFNCVSKVTAKRLETHPEH